MRNLILGLILGALIGLLARPSTRANAQTKGPYQLVAIDATGYTDVNGVYHRGYLYLAFDATSGMICAPATIGGTTSAADIKVPFGLPRCQ